MELKWMTGEKNHSNIQFLLAADFSFWGSFLGPYRFTQNNYLFNLK